MDQMVLQRNQPFSISGKGVPSQIVSIVLYGTTFTGKVGVDSGWRITLPPQPTNGNGTSIHIISGKEEQVLKNILFGDVWLCIGQSNMEWPLAKEMHYKTEAADLPDTLIRIYNPVYAGKNIYGTSYTDSVLKKLSTQHFYKGKWELSNQQSLQTMSAVAYYFGKSIVQTATVPIGLVNLAIGGAPLETFIDVLALKRHPVFRQKLQGDWLYNTHLPDWIRERGLQNLSKHSNAPSDVMGKYHAYKPGFAYRAGIEPYTMLPIKGIICYQGESNAQETERVKEYGEFTRAMVEDFRNKWKDTTLPYYFVQLSSIDTVKYKSALWPLFRNEQRLLTENLSYSGMAVCSDIGARDDVHPVNKKEVGLRLARWALHDLYAKKIVPSGPVPGTARYRNGKIIIRFSNIAQRLMIKGASQSEKTVTGFSLHEQSIQKVVLRKNKVILHVAGTRKPGNVFYGWEPYSLGNLFNAEGLPASTFKLKVL